MATIVGTQTADEEKERMVTLKGTAQMNPGDEVLQIDIPPENQAPTGRVLEIRWEVKLIEQEVTV